MRSPGRDSSLFLELLLARSISPKATAWMPGLQPTALLSGVFEGRMVVHHWHAYVDIPRSQQPSSLSFCLLSTKGWTDLLPRCLVPPQTQSDRVKRRCIRNSNNELQSSIFFLLLSWSSHFYVTVTKSLT